MNNNNKYEYMLESISAQKALDELSKYILGDDWYIVDPLGVEQCNFIILNEIKRKFDSKKSIFDKIISYFK